MAIRDKIDLDYKNSLKLKDKIKISTYRLILSGIKELDINNRSGPQKKETDDNDIKKKLNKEPNQSRFIRKIIEMICFKLKCKSKKFYQATYQNK